MDRPARFEMPDTFRHRIGVSTARLQTKMARAGASFTL